LAENETPSRVYLWFDTEYTDLDPAKARLLQVSLVATDARFRRLAPPERDVNLVLRLDPEAEVSAWVRTHLAGLLDRCRSEEAVSPGEADRRLVTYARECGGTFPGGPPVLAGNSVYADLQMARTWLPEFYRLLHYRLLDVTALKLLYEDTHPPHAHFDKDDPALILRYLPGEAGRLEGAQHDAYYDILASISELNFYRHRLGLTDGEPP